TFRCCPGRGRWPLANARPARQAPPGQKRLQTKRGIMKSTGFLLIAALTVAGIPAPSGAQPGQQPVEIAQLPYIEIFSPTFFWNDEADTIRTGSSTCPKGRAIAGGLNILQGKAALRVVESY